MTVYEEVVAVSKIYLGPATEQFIARQCKILKLEAKFLGKADLQPLAKWVEIGAGLLMDEKKAKELASKVRAI